MDWQYDRLREGAGAAKRWVSHAGHGSGAVATPPGPHKRRSLWLGGPFAVGKSSSSSSSPRLLTLDGSEGEGGGQILRTALTLSMLTGRAFRIVKIRANRDKPGLRPQHLTAVLAAAELARAEVSGASVGSRDLTFRPGSYVSRDLTFEIGTAGATALVLQTLHLPLALRTDRPLRVTLTGGTFNTKAPSYPFLDATWRAHLGALGAPIALAMPTAGFYPRGGGRLDAWIEPARLQPLTVTERGPLRRIVAAAGVARLQPEIAERMAERALMRLNDHFEGVAIEVSRSEWNADSPGAAIALTAEYEGVSVPVTFVGLGERGKPAEKVADEAIDELLAHDAVANAAVDVHSADQLLVPLALANGRSEYTVSEVSEHLRTNARTIRAFLDREITVVEPTGDRPGRMTVG